MQPRGVSCSGIVSLVFTAMALGQVTEPRFEVASVRMRQAARGPRGNPVYQAEAGRLTFTNVSAISVIAEAYQLPPTSIGGLPSWAFNERFDISAKAETEAGRSELLRMLQPLLVERFGMRSHMEDRKVRGWVLTVARGGPNLTAADPEEVYERFRQAAGTLTARNITMAEFASSLSRNVPFPVVDQTGLEGLYNIDVRLELGSRVVLGQDYADELRRAIERDLGLRIQERDVTVSFLIVDRIELPGEN